MKTIQKYAIFIAFSWIAALPAMENKQYDLTNPAGVSAWAKSQGISMTLDEQLAMTGRMLAEKVWNTYQPATYAHYDLTRASQVEEWAQKNLKVILFEKETQTFAQRWQELISEYALKQTRNVQRENEDLRRALKASRDDQKPINNHNNNNPSSQLPTSPRLRRTSGTGRAGNNEPAEIDLTSVDGVLKQARAQGVKMTREEAAAIVKDVLFQQQVQNMIENVEINNAPEVKPEAVSNNADEVSENECPICLMDMDPNDKSIVAISKNCSHKFHPKCSAEIKQKFTQCPICQANIK